jgi:hypothetical protein
MKSNAGPAMSARDADAVAAAFDRIAAFAPPGYPSWASIAKDGAAAARAQELEAARAACRSCHEQYRPRYREERRGAPL